MAYVDFLRARGTPLHSSHAVRALRLATAAAALVLLGACGGSGSDDDPPVQQPANPAATTVGQVIGDAITASIGAAGGHVESADGALRIDVPAGAFATDQDVSIQSITNHAHGRIGGAFRLRPEGAGFAAPVKITFSFSPDDIAGTSARLLRIASQKQDGFWQVHEDVTLDEDEGTLSVETSHFSDWSLVTGAQLSPVSATVKPGESASLSVVVCERVQGPDQLAPLLAECQPSQVIRNLTRNWSVNGTPGGNATVGTIVVQEDRSAVYTAPAQAPQANPVAVSTEYTTLQREQVTLVSSIRIQAGLCTPANPGEPCYFDLVQFNGKPLPYEDLPRNDWENPEHVVSGRLSLRDSDNNGDGTWTLRVHWVERRLSGDLEQFEQLAGDFTSGDNGQLRFTVLRGSQFTGALDGTTVSIGGYPFSSQNTSLPVDLKLVQAQ